MSRRAESPLSSRMIFTSSSAAGDHIERGFAVAGGWSPQYYGCSFCGREFKSAQALGGHMNIHRRDRARLRTSMSSPRHAVDLPPAPQNTPKSAHSTLNLPFEAACKGSFTSISTSLNTYLPSTIISATPTFKPVVMRSVADPADRLAMAAPSSHDENFGASFSVPTSDLVSFRSGSTLSSSATSLIPKVQNVAHSLFPNTAHRGSSLLITPILDKSSFKTAEALNVCGRAGQFRPDCSGGGGYNSPQRIQLSEAKGCHKRRRGNDLDAVKISNEDKSAATRACSSCVGPSSHDVAHNVDIKELKYCLDLELRLGQSSPAAPAGN